VPPRYCYLLVRNLHWVLPFRAKEAGFQSVQATQSTVDTTGVWISFDFLSNVLCVPFGFLSVLLGMYIFCLISFRSS
jgi:hypothetical protein